MDLKRSEREARRLLAHSWGAFFSPFPHLLPIQRLTIPKVLQGRNLVISSPAATGKTEAVMAPLAELLIEEGWRGLSILYVSPTRALVNDLYKRLKGPLSGLRIGLSRKTMDHPEFDPLEPTSVLVTTPESFDSLICRAPQVFESLRAVCLDEIHLLDGTYRGDQLMVLLQRLRLLRKGPICFYTLSATISDPISLGERYFFPFEIVQAKGRRMIKYTLLPFDDSLKELTEKLRSEGVKKVLVFCNTRKKVEEVALLFKRSWKYPERVWVHHASLSRREREEVERGMNRERVGICVATMTLELGVDIGDIEAVVLVSPPPSLSALLQRLGRGNRRKGELVAYGLYRDEWELTFFNLLFELAQSGWMEDEESPLHLSISVQQILSYLYQKRRIGATPEAIQRVLSPLGLELTDVLELLLHLERFDFVQSPGGGVYWLGPGVEAMAERGFIHSNIARSQGSYQVYDLKSGKEIGSIETLSPQFVLKGRSWEVERQDGSKIFVRPLGQRGDGVKGVFCGGGGRMWGHRLGAKLKRKLFAGAKEDDLPFCLAGKITKVYHFLGPMWGGIWARYISLIKGVKAEDLGGILMTLEGNPEELEEFLRLSDEEMEVVLEKIKGPLLEQLNLGAFFRYLPPSFQDEALRQALVTEQMVDYIGRFNPLKVEECP